MIQNRYVAIGCFVALGIGTAALNACQAHNRSGGEEETKPTLQETARVPVVTPIAPSTVVLNTHKEPLGSVEEAIEINVLRPLRENFENRGRFSRAVRLAPQYRMTVATVVEPDVHGASFLSFTITNELRPKSNLVLRGCVYTKTNQVYLERGRTKSRSEIYVVAAEHPAVKGSFRTPNEDGAKREARGECVPSVRKS